MNLMIDQDEKIEGMCSKCKEDIKKDTCTRCGEVMESERAFVKNSSFDESKFKAMAEDGE
ncbi:hypothetical protein [Tepidibacter hydrothermalis]|uniref:Phage protein n=1 Tax=Tepidibacter hydrothermalis TaxID=3036126 RepID=A0ABY8EHM3_9FIRM|nr:hypothetical protein [Tepidibacter hydrothermalis]WFD12455.1 hypothetical protein P4S50_19950 [Tepidibacter hydrothermalis]